MTTVRVGPSNSRGAKAAVAEVSFPFDAEIWNILLATVPPVDREYTKTPKGGVWLIDGVHNVDALIEAVKAIAGHTASDQRPPVLTALTRLVTALDTELAEPLLQSIAGVIDPIVIAKVREGLSQ